MSTTRIGGPHKCNIHPEFETDDTEAFNEHCRTAEGHTTSGVIPCSGCGISIQVDNIPFQDIGKDIRLQCPSCYQQNDDLNRLVNSQQQVEVGGEGA